MVYNNLVVVPRVASILYVKRWAIQSATWTGWDVQRAAIISCSIGHICKWVRGKCFRKNTDTKTYLFDKISVWRIPVNSSSVMVLNIDGYPGISVESQHCSFLPLPPPQLVFRCDSGRNYTLRRRHRGGANGWGDTHQRRVLENTRCLTLLHNNDDEARQKGLVPTNHGKNDDPGQIFRLCCRSVSVIWTMKG